MKTMKVVSRFFVLASLILPELPCIIGIKKNVQSIRNDQERYRLRKKKGKGKDNGSDDGTSKKGKKSVKTTINRERLTGEEDMNFESLDKDELRKELYGEVFEFSINELYYKNDAQQCTKFHTNPKFVPGSTNDEKRTTWIKQVRPCGYYDSKQMFKDSNCREATNPEIIQSNTDYPGNGKMGDVRLDKPYRVRFDVGRHRNQPSGGPPNWKNINFSAIDYTPGVSVPHSSQIMSTTTGIDQETCLETFVFGGEDWGDFGHSSYDCMGYCGDGCSRTWVSGTGLDCLKHDVCSYYKSWIQGFAAGWFCADVDCGDEAAQTVINCWDENGWFPDFMTVCRDAPEVYTEINPAAKLFLDRQACLDRTGWDKDQGMPRPWNFP